MNYDWILQLPRGTGHSTSACGQHADNTVVVSSTMRQGQDLKKRFGVNVTSLTRGDLAAAFEGKAVVFDTEAVQTIVREYEYRLGEIRQALGQG